MDIVTLLLSKNKAWSLSVQEEDPDFFKKLQDQQNPCCLWIGCSDSRVPANQVVGLVPGQVFVHRNVANLVVHSDLNCLAVLQYAVKVLKIEHIFVVGHYGCGGVQAALSDTQLGLIDNWLRHVRDIRQKHGSLFEGHAQTTDQEWDLLCALNVIEQVRNVCHTTVVEEAWAHGQALAVHGWIYDLQDGLLSDLKTSIHQAAERSARYQAAIERIAAHQKPLRGGTCANPT